MRSKMALYNISSNLLLQLIIVVYGFIVPKIIISSFGSEVNGLVASITQFLAYIALLESGFGPVVKAALYKPIANKNNNEIANILRTSEKIFRTIAYIFIVYIVLLCLLYPLLVENTHSYLYTISLIVIISISTFAEYFFGMTYRLFLQANQKGYIISIIQIITYIASIVIIVLLAKAGASIQLIKLSSGVIFVLRPIFQNCYVKKKYNINFKNLDEKYELKQKWDGLAQHIATVIHRNADVTVLTFFTNLTEVSVYSVYYLVIKGVKSITEAFNQGIDSSFGDMIAKNESENLNNKYNLYEVIYFTILTIIFSCTILLITPFISVYTKGITDVNYIRYGFGYLLVVSEYIWAIRLPYSTITLAAGHFKETQKGAWIEALINIILSVILVWKLGIVGVAIGTIVAMSIRTIEYINHTNKYILGRNAIQSYIKILLVIFETIIIFIISNFVPWLSNITYVNWIINAIITVGISSTVVILLNMVIYKKEIKAFENIIIKIIKKKRGNKNENN